MSKQPMGKTLLRNVIRHTDAHNKIQEEMEMWKMRDWEVQMSRHKHFPDTDSVRGQMHCDRVPDLSRNRSRVSEHDDREARYWTRKLYEFEASDPDRWGHSGFKELYPEEFESDNEKSRAAKKTGGHKMKKSKSDTEACLLKRSKKSSRKKKKKKKKKSGNEKRKKDESSSSDVSADDRNDTKDKQKKKTRTKSRHKNKKTRERNEDSSSEDSSSEEKDKRRTKSCRKRKQESLKDSDLELGSKKKRRKNWKAAGEESSDNSPTD
ncbi:uncharacterized protein NKAPD1 [Austrofundulus limnaeus]|uniref:Uncharacterized protein C11orf57 homolog n=1 Tax=Austrofundulus limnaeus TaxID=52670 RepID=A0A2I4CTV9_AUSLI|nr:PREDICTED: uncharacterized protein C11orf57 homolog [Austrofundulus limnaeus]XP_013883414.1 PREDICTED: uncharacterized protein C11orf57 homolog [Austrofundulus limnaeus]